jgi:ubiquitin carboxyl-terminal hydrolase L5
MRFSSPPSASCAPLVVDTRVPVSPRGRPVYGLIFLFKYNGEKPTAPVSEDANADGVFFASQVIQNACATQAILSILMNCPDDVPLGDELANMREFTREFDADLKGLAISNSEKIRAAHNSFARPEPIVGETTNDPKNAEDLFHFVAYVPKNGALYELDGLQRGPIAHGACGETEWLARACPVIRERIEKYASSEIRFNLMALVRDRKDVLEEKIAAATAKTEAGAFSSQAEKAELEVSVHEWRDALDRETERRAAWRDENIRRKHNYIPFIFNLLEACAERGALRPIIDKARGS